MRRRDPHAPGPGLADYLGATLVLIAFVGYLVASTYLIDAVMGVIAP